MYSLSHGLFGRAVDGAQRAERLAERLRPRGGPMQPRVAEAAAPVTVTPSWYVIVL